MFSAWLLESSKLFNVSIHAYVLMSEHFQLLVTPSDEIGLARMMQWVGRHYVPYYNRKYGRTGTLWESRYKTSVIEAEMYLLECCCYIEMEPVRSGIAAAPAAYPWSSYPHHSGAKLDPLITDHPLYWALGNTPFAREAAYRDLILNKQNPDKVEVIGRRLQKGQVLGSEPFQIALEKLTNRRVRPAKRGRPYKIQRSD